MSYLDEVHARATIDAARLDGQRPRPPRRSWFRRLRAGLGNRWCELRARYSAIRRAAR